MAPKKCQRMRGAFRWKRKIKFSISFAIYLNGAILFEIKIKNEVKLWIYLKCIYGRYICSVYVSM